MPFFQSEAAKGGNTAPWSSEETFRGKGVTVWD